MQLATFYKAILSLSFVLAIHLYISDKNVIQTKQNSLGANTSISTLSDRRLKENVIEVPYGINEVMELNPVSFNWLGKPEKGIKLGLIAQDVQQLMPELVEVGEGNDKILRIYYDDMIPVLVKAIQQQQMKIERLENQLYELKKK